MWLKYQESLEYHYMNPLADHKSFEGEPIGGQLLVNISPGDLRRVDLVGVDNAEVLTIATTNVVSKQGRTYEGGIRETLSERFSTALARRNQAGIVSTKALPTEVPLLDRYVDTPASQVLYAKAAVRSLQDGEHALRELKMYALLMHRSGNL